MSNNGTISTSTQNHIATIEFYHPKGNSLPGALLRELAETITQTGAQNDVKVIILKSRGDGAFCAGASFDELVAIDNYEEGKKFFMGFALVINAIRTCPKFVIGRVHGKTVGGGVGLAAAADYTLATNDASIKLSELALGIGPFVVGPAVERKVGTSAFASLSIDAASWNTATWAKEKGLYADVLDSHKALDDAVSALAGQLSGYSPEAMQELKKVLWQGTDHWDELLEERAEISGRLVLSEFTKEFIRKFKEK